MPQYQPKQEQRRVGSQFADKYLLNCALKLPPLTKEQEYELAVHRMFGCTQARERMILSQVPLAYKIAPRYRWTRLAIDDLISESVLAVIDAVDRFHPDLQCRLSSWAGQKIHFRLTRLQPQASVVSVPDYRTIKRREDTVELYKRAVNGVAEFNTVDHDRAARTVPRPYADIDRELLHRFIDDLPALQSAIAQLRFAGYSMQAVSEIVGVTASRVSQLEPLILKRLRQRFGNRDQAERQRAEQRANRRRETRRSEDCAPSPQDLLSRQSSREMVAA